MTVKINSRKPGKVCSVVDCGETGHVRIKMDRSGISAWFCKAHAERLFTRVLPH